MDTLLTPQQTGDQMSGAIDFAKVDFIEHFDVAEVPLIPPAPPSLKSLSPDRAPADF